MAFVPQISPPNSSLSHEALVECLRASGESTRLRILAILEAGELTVKDLTVILGQSQPRISRHLRLLAEAGLVVRSTEGAFAFYRLAEKGNGFAARALLDLLDDNDPVLSRDRDRRDATRRSNADAAARYFAANAEVWDKVRSMHAPEAEVEATITQLLGGRRIDALLDIGTGTGRMLELLAGKTSEATGIDASAAMLSVARANLDGAGVTNARLAQDDIYALSQPNDAFDVVVCHQVLHFLEDPARAIQEAARVLAPSGRLLVVDFAPHALEALRTEAQHRRLGIGRVEMEAWLTAAGLETTDVIDLTGSGSELTVTLWLAEDPRILSDDVRHPEGAFA